ncbi:energy-coupling factor ABC transporter ATP-binding protein [Desulfovibrio aminophilus]
MNALFRLENAVVRYAGAEILRVESLEVPERSVFGLAGHNGSGKSTLLRLLALLERPTSGRVLVDGADSAGRERELRRGITLLDQEPYLLRRSVRENVAYGPRARGDVADLDRRVAEALDWVGLAPGFARRSWRELSGGEAQRVALAARLVLRPRALLLDEPTANLDAESVARINLAALRAREEWGATLVLVSHDMAWLSEMADTVLHLHHGRVAGRGRTNILRGSWLEEPGGSRLDRGDDVPLRAPAAPAPDSPAAVEPGDITLLPAADAATARFDTLLPAVVEELSRDRDGLLALCRAGDLRLLVRVAADRAVVPGTPVALGMERRAVRFLD